MKHALIVLGCTLAIAGGNALAQDRSSSSTATHESAGDSVGQKARHAADRAGDAAHRAGDKARSAMHRGEHKMSKAHSDHDRKTAQARDDTRALGASGSSTSADSDRQRRMDEAYNDYKSGRPSDSQTR